MFGRSRRNDDAPATPAPVPGEAQGEPWSADGVHAMLTAHAFGRRGKTRPVVRFSVGDLEFELHLADLVGLLKRRQFIADSIEAPLVFVCWPESASRTSAAEAAMTGVPRDHLVVLAEPMGDAPTALLAPAAIASLQDWLTATTAPAAR